MDAGNDAKVEVVGTGVGRAGSFEDEATRLRQRYRRHVREHRELEARPSARSREDNGGPGPAPDNVVAQQLARLERFSTSTGHRGSGGNDGGQQIAREEDTADQRGAGVVDPGPADVRAEETSNDPDRRVDASEGSQNNGVAANIAGDAVLPAAPIVGEADADASSVGNESNTTTSETHNHISCLVAGNLAESARSPRQEDNPVVEEASNDGPPPVEDTRDRVVDEVAVQPNVRPASAGAANALASPSGRGGHVSGRGSGPRAGQGAIRLSRCVGNVPPSLGRGASVLFEESPGRERRRAAAAAAASRRAGLQMARSGPGAQDNDASSGDEIMNERSVFQPADADAAATGATHQGTSHVLDF